MTNPATPAPRSVRATRAGAAPDAIVRAGRPTRPDKARKKPISTTSTPDGPVLKAEVDANPFRGMGGSKEDDFNNVILRETLVTIWIPDGENDGQRRRISAGMTALMAFKPKDEIEGMLAAQAVALHFGAMECFRRAMHKEQPFDIASKLRKDGANLARGMAEMLDALDRKRGKGPQVVRVERVVVHEGGRAIVGNVSPGTVPPHAALEAPQPAAQLDQPLTPARLPAGRPGGGEH